EYEHEHDDLSISLRHYHEIGVVRFARAFRLIAVAHDADADQIGDGRLLVAAFEVVAELDVGVDGDRAPLAERRAAFDDHRVLRAKRIALPVARGAFRADGAPNVLQ